VFLEVSSNNIRRRIAILGTVLIVTPMLVLGLAGWATAQRMQHPTPLYGSSATPLNLTHLTRNLVQVCRSYRQASIDKLKSGQSILDAAGGIRVEGTRTSLWQAKNEITGEVKTLQLPLMMAGGTEIAPVVDFDQVGPLVDQIASVEGTPATIFQRMNERGDMLRVSSSMKSETGVRAVNSYIPAEAATGEEAKALQAVLDGKTYIGKEMLDKVSYLTAYQPLKNKLDNIVGMLYTVLPEDQISAKVRLLAAARKNADHGELFVLEATGERRGTALVMGDPSIDGTDLWNEKDTSGRPYVQELCSRALQLTGGQIAEYRYQKPALAGGLPRTVIAQFAYVQELDWVVGFAQPEASALAGTPPLALAAWAVWLLLGVGVAGTGLAVRIWLRFTDDLAHKLDSLLARLRKDAKQLTMTAVELSEEAERAGAAKTPVQNPLNLPRRSAEILPKVGRMSEEMSLALRHLDASGESVAGILGTIDQITLATNLLMVNAAIEASNSPNGNERMAGVADGLRFLADQCRQAARTTKAEIDQSRAELEKGNREVEQLVQDLRWEDAHLQPRNETAVALRRQSETLLRLAEGIGRTVEVIAADFGVESN
jgi:methyl-accepting chemotaxis protein